jgi:hypothetical protein
MGMTVLPEEVVDEAENGAAGGRGRDEFGAILGFVVPNVLEIEDFREEVLPLPDEGRFLFFMMSVFSESGRTTPWSL